MSNSFQDEIPSGRVNIKLDLHTGGSKAKVELPLKLLSIGDFSNGKESRPVGERNKVMINKNNFNNVLADINPEINIDIKNTLADDNSDRTVNLNFKHMKDFEPENVARQIPELRALLSMRNLLRDLKSNLLDNLTFRKELEKILKDETLSEELRLELERLAKDEK